MTVGATRPGFGERHPAVTALLTSQTPVGTQKISWRGGTMPLLVSAYSCPADLPEVLVTSVRCVVRVGDRIVLCENVDGVHLWPGGRRSPGESYVDTAVREVHEETGWLLDRDNLNELGWLHLEHLAPRRPNDPHPYPDFLQVVFYGTAAERDGQPDVAWSDTDGYELRSRLVTIDEAREISTDRLALALLGVLPGGASPEPAL